ncbi:MAG: hypothetical protein CSA33_06140 [Desulfobulbus propionicus]|nr:MAG: hypothetical protein CSA33_06140 [Desulfobulbus propionicus]
MSEPTSSYKNAELLHNVDKPDGLLEQLGLPPKTKRFIREHTKQIWTVSIIILVTVTSVSLYGSYRAYRLNKAASELDAAIQAPQNGEEKLQEVMEKYSSMDAATWAKVALVRRYHQKKQYDKELQLLMQMDRDLDTTSILKPLISSKIASVYEVTGENEKALGMYTLLAETAGFEAESYLAMGRIHETMQNREQALVMYSKYLEWSAGHGGQFGQQDPARSVVVSKLRRLRRS